MRNLMAPSPLAILFYSVCFSYNSYRTKTINIRAKKKHLFDKFIEQEDYWANNNNIIGTSLHQLEKLENFFPYKHQTKS